MKKSQTVWCSTTSLSGPHAVPSSPPLNLSGQVLSPSTLSITWQPPAPDGQNGVIVSYTVQLIERPTNTTFTYQRGGSHTEVFITNLHPYYEYSCSVAAETSVGLGPFSIPFILTTHQDGEGRPSYHCARDRACTLALASEIDIVKMQKGQLASLFDCVTFISWAYLPS